MFTSVFYMNFESLGVGGDQHWYFSTILLQSQKRKGEEADVSLATFWAGVSLSFIKKRKHHVFVIITHSKQAHPPFQQNFVKIGENWEYGIFRQFIDKMTIACGLTDPGARLASVWGSPYSSDGLVAWGHSFPHACVIWT